MFLFHALLCSERGIGAINGWHTHATTPNYFISRLITCGSVFQPAAFRVYFQACVS
ncbi:hypothetical protein BX600DRAFT_313481 [Xylariales sp. PMI_506]|nr:hypothetical protein BX600DRAFT_313481 [Xylariales sp. PMI_506]